MEANFAFLNKSAHKESILEWADVLRFLNFSFSMQNQNYP